jgi:hypothetical protein
LYAKAKKLRLHCMKLWFTALISLCILSCRTFEGKYYESFGEGWGGAHYQFRDNGTFSYRSSYDLGGDTGTGTYRILAGRIRFEFDSTQPRAVPAPRMTMIRRANEDSSRVLRVRVTDETGYGLPGAIVMLSDGPVQRTAATSLEGEAYLPDNIRQDSVVLIIRYTGYHRVETRISLKSVQRVNVQMIPDNEGMLRPIAAGTVWSYRFSRMHSGELLLSRTRYSVEYDEKRRKLMRHRTEVKLEPR